MDISQIKKRLDTNTFWMLVFVFATGGWYAIIWLAFNARALESAFKTEKTTNGIIAFLSIGYIWSIGIIATGFDGWIEIVIGSILIIAFLVTYYSWIFKITDGLKQYALNTYGINYNTNGFFALLFSVAYINYCINDLDKIVNNFTTQNNTNNNNQALKNSQNTLFK